MSTRCAQQRRRFAFACLDWSERRPHLGGALGAALLDLAFKRRWVSQDLDSRALTVTPVGRRELLKRFGLPISDSGGYGVVPAAIQPVRREARYGKNGFDDTRISVSNGTVSTARSPLGLRVPSRTTSSDDVRGFRP